VTTPTTDRGERRPSPPLLGPRAKRAARPALAALVLAAGYADLARGGVTLAPLLLVLGYCVLVPAALRGG
jgi:hypothetical protein